MINTSFTEDGFYIDWAKKIVADRKTVYVDWNKGENSWADMALMSKFKNIIIANSTFSWWAAWLGMEDKNVICPRVLVYNDLNSDIKIEYNQQINTADGTFIGKNMKDAVAYFNNPDNKPVREMYEAKLKLTSY